MQQLHFRGFEQYLKPRKARDKRKQRFAKYLLPVLPFLVVSVLALSFYNLSRSRLTQQRTEEILTSIEKREKQLEDYEKRKPELIEAIEESHRLQDSITAQQARLDAKLKEAQLLNAIIEKRIGLSGFSEADKVSINDILLQIFNMSLEDVSLSYNVYKIIFILFDWIRDNIEYIAGTEDDRVPLSPADVLLYRRGDCDEQAVLLSGLINTILGASTRIISTVPDNDGVGHGYLQFYLGDYKTTDYKNLKAELIVAIQKHYGVSGSVAEDYTVRGLDLDLNGYWLTFDTTAEYPGESCNSYSDCKPESIIYQW